jgi:DinB superfamily
MNKTELISSLSSSYTSFNKCIDLLNDKDFLFAPPEKWTPAQQLDHLCRSTKPLILATILPHFILGLMFGKANRPSKTYDELVEKYLKKLSEGYKATGNYIPPPVGADKRNSLTQKLSGIISSINKNIENFSEEELDKYNLPHPLLGKLTLREMLYFTAYHAQHHEKIVSSYFN